MKHLNVTSYFKSRDMNSLCCNSHLLNQKRRYAIIAYTAGCPTTLQYGTAHIICRYKNELRQGSFFYSTMEHDDKKAFIEGKIDGFFDLSLRRATALGTIFWIISALVEYVYNPGNFRQFKEYRIAIIIILFIIAILSRYVKNRYVQYALAYAAIIASAITIEIMVLKTGGHRSTYYVGVILLAVYVFGLMPARFFFHLSLAISIYVIYLVPILLTETISDLETFTTSMFFMVSVLLCGLVFQYMNHKRVRNELSLRYDSDQDKKKLRRYADIVKNMQVGLHVYCLEDIDDDRSLRLIAANPASSVITGIADENAIGKTVDESFPGLRERGISQIFAEVVRTGRARELEDVRFGSNRSIGRVLSIRVFPMPDNYVGVAFEDVTERKRLKEERIKIRNLESLGFLAGGISHDFNNLLTIILGNISLIKISEGQDDKVVKRLAATESAALKAMDLTRQLLTFSGNGAPSKKPTAIGDDIREVAAFGLSGSNIMFKSDIPDDLWTIDVDRNQIKQVIHNMVLNAREAMPEGGKLSIAAENIEVKRGDIPELTEGKYIKISVADTGSGIAEYYQSKIFDPYFTTENMGSEKGKGLGLAICHSIIKSHNGIITVTSEFDEGTTFEVYLPASDISLKKDRGAAVDRDISVEIGKVLIMDDEDGVRDIAGDMFREMGISVAFARDGNEAIKIYEDAMKSGRSIDIVILDLTIPGSMGGETVIRHLQKIDPNVKALVASGYSNNAVIDNPEEYGFIGAIPKPFDFHTLKESILTAIDMKDK
jgi:signal transduction histidine kinase/CheY-like chemotaxis protein